MTETAQQEVLQSAEDLLAKFPGSDLTFSEIFKARQSFFEHLMLLNAGTLSLLLTVICAIAASNHLNTFHLKDGSRLVIGCWMLILSIILSLIHNHLNLTFAAHMFGFRLSSGMHVSVVRFKEAYLKAVGQPPPPEPGDLGEQAEESLRKSKTTETLCRYIGPAAQVLTILAYVEFVVSMRATISSMVP